MDTWHRKINLNDDIKIFAFVKISRDVQRQRDRKDIIGQAGKSSSKKYGWDKSWYEIMLKYEAKERYR